LNIPDKKGEGDVISLGELLKKIKSSPWGLLLVVGLGVGIALTAIGGMFSDEESKNELAATESDGLTSVSKDSVDEYASYLEKRIKNLIEKMDGVTDADVMVTVDCSGELVLARDKTYVDGALAQSRYVFDENGTVTLKEILPYPRGVAVVCGGGSDPIVQSKIIDMLCSLFGIPANRVSVSG